MAFLLHLNYELFLKKGVRVMSSIAKTSFRTFIAEHVTAIRFWIGLLSAYFGTKLTSVVAFAQYDPSSRTSGDSAGAKTFADIFFGFLGPLQDFATVVLILSAVVCGMKIGASGMVGESRTRTNAIVGLFFIIVGEVVVLHAQALVAMATGISVNGQQ